MALSFAPAAIDTWPLERLRPYAHNAKTHAGGEVPFLGRGKRVKQSRLMSLVEAVANVVVGYGIAVLTQLAVSPRFGLPAHLMTRWQSAGFSPSYRSGVDSRSAGCSRRSE